MSIIDPDPVVTMKQRWEVRPGHDISDWLDRDIQWLSVAAGKWEYATESGIQGYQVTIEDRGEMYVSRSLSGWFRYLIYFSICLVPLAILFPSWHTALILSWVGVYGLNYDTSPLTDSPAIQITHQVSNAVAVLYFVGFVTWARIVAAMAPSLSHRLFIILICVLYASSRLYTNNALPRQSYSVVSHVVRIPLDAVRSISLPVTAILVAGVSGAWVERATKLGIEALQSREDVRAFESIASDIVGGSANLPELILYLMVLAREWFPLLICLYCVRLSLSWNRETAKSGTHLYAQLTTSTVAAASSGRSKLLRAGLSLFWGNIALVLTAGVVVTLLTRVSARFDLPVVPLEPLSPYLPSTIESTTEGLVGSVFTVFQSAASSIPFTLGENGILILLLLTLAPAVYISVGFVFLLVVTPVRILWTLIQSSTVDCEPETTVPFVRRTDHVSGIVPIRIFGKTVCIFLGPEIGESTSSEQLRSLLSEVRRGGQDQSVLLLLLSIVVVFVPGGRIIRRSLSPPTGSVRIDRLNAEWQTASSTPETNEDEPDQRERSLVGNLLNDSRRMLSQRLQAHMSLFRLYYGTNRSTS